MRVFCATVMFPPLPPFTSIVRVTLTGVPPLLLTVNVMSTVFPAVRETAERLAAPIWIEGSGDVTVRVMLTRRRRLVVVALTVIV